MEIDHKIPLNLLARLQEHFDGLIPRNLFLVKQNTKLNRVYRTYGSSAVKNNIYIAFKIEKSEGYTCDYLLDADGYTEHRRYNLANDEITLLENFEGRLGGSDFIDDEMDYAEHMRIMKKNSEIRKMLIKKGFLRK